MKKFGLLLLILFLSACAVAPEDLFVVTPELLQRRQIETRRYDGLVEADLLSASANVLQDLGFNLENSETKLGVLTASKERSAIDRKEVAAAVAITLLGGQVDAISKDQTIRVALVVRPVLASTGKPYTKSYFIRVTFQRIVRRTDNSIYTETLSDKQLYQDFYDRLSKSVFLEAQKI